MTPTYIRVDTLPGGIRIRAERPTAGGGFRGFSIDMELSDARAFRKALDLAISEAEASLC